ncbi:MAG: heme-binding protein [Verrucomicrobiota bacterium]
MSGENATGEKIAMTTPVFMPSSSTGDAQSMQFVLPEKVATAGAPAPNGRQVDLTQMNNGTYAALRFKGYRKVSQQKAALKQLREAIAEAGLKEQGQPIFAYYDPPWTPEAMRRNEVLIRVK